MSWYGWKPYIPVAERRARALKKMQRLRKKGLEVRPVEIRGRKIAHTFWGQAWCAHLEKFSDYSNRLPRGRAYVRNGSVCHLEIAAGAVKAMVSGSRLYDVNVAIKKLPRKKWNEVKRRCTGQIGSVLELLQGRLSKSIMAVVTDRDQGLFPLPKEIGLECTCPDWAVMCKHVAAVLYGVGARLDEQPELLFLLRGVKHQELIAAGTGAAAVIPAGEKSGRGHIAEASLGEIFGIDLSEEAPAAMGAGRGTPPTATKRAANPRSAARTGTTSRLVRRARRRRTASGENAPGRKVSTKRKTAIKPVSTRPARKRRRSRGGDRNLDGAGQT